MRTLLPDLALGDPTAAAIVASMQAGEWQAAHAALGSIADPHQREFALIAATSALEGSRPDWLDEWVDTHPQSPVAWLVRGRHGINWAWEARGHHHAEYTEDAQFALFFERLRSAEADLMQAAMLDPGDGIPWSFLVISARGLQTPTEEMVQRFEQAQSRCPWLLEAHLQLLQGLCEKWSGSHELMFNFARLTTESAPVGSPVHAVVPTAHFEYWVAQDDLPDAYFADPEVASEVAAAAARSIDLPDFGATGPSCSVRHNFAACYALGRLVEPGRRQFELIGDRFQEWPWSYYGEPGGVFLELRERCIAPAG